MSELSFDVNGDPLPRSRSSKKRHARTTGVRVIRTPSPSNLATTTITHKRQSTSGSSRSSDKSLRLVTDPTGIVVGDLQSDTIGVVDRASSASPYRYTTASRASSFGGSISPKTSYRVIRDKTRTPSPDSQFEVEGTVNNPARYGRSGMCKSTKLVADPSGKVVQDLKADTTGFIDRPDHQTSMPSPGSSRRSSASGKSYRIVKVPKDMAVEDLQFGASRKDMHSEPTHDMKPHATRSSRSRSPASDQKKTAVPAIPSGPSTPAELYAMVFGNGRDSAGIGRRASSLSSSISSGYIKAAGKGRRRRRRGGRA
jgi:hypothetical protein